MNIQPTEKLTKINNKIENAKINLDWFSTSGDKCMIERQNQVKGILYSLRNVIICFDLNQFYTIYEFIMKIDEHEHYTVIMRKISELLKICDSEIGINDEISECLAGINKTLHTLMDIVRKNNDPGLVDVRVMLMYEEEIVKYRKQYIDAYEAYQQTLEL